MFIRILSFFFIIIFYLAVHYMIFVKDADFFVIKIDEFPITISKYNGLNTKKEYPYFHTVTHSS